MQRVTPKEPARVAPEKPAWDSELNWEWETGRGPSRDWVVIPPSWMFSLQWCGHTNKYLRGNGDNVLKLIVWSPLGMNHQTGFRHPDKSLKQVGLLCVAPQNQTFGAQPNPRNVYAWIVHHCKKSRWIWMSDNRGLGFLFTCKNNHLQLCVFDNIQWTKIQETHGVNSHPFVNLSKVCFLPPSSYMELGWNYVLAQSFSHFKLKDRKMHEITRMISGQGIVKPSRSVTELNMNQTRPGSTAKSAHMELYLDITTNPADLCWTRWDISAFTVRFVSVRIRCSSTWVSSKCVNTKLRSSLMWGTSMLLKGTRTVCKAGNLGMVTDFKQSDQDNLHTGTDMNVQYSLWKQRWSLSCTDLQKVIRTEPDSVLMLFEARGNDCVRFDLWHEWEPIQTAHRGTGQVCQVGCNLFIQIQLWHSTHAT